VPKPEVKEGSKVKSSREDFEFETRGNLFLYCLFLLSFLRKDRETSLFQSPLVNLSCS